MAKRSVKWSDKALDDYNNHLDYLLENAGFDTAVLIKQRVDFAIESLGSVYEFRIVFDLVKMNFEAERLAASIGNTCKSFDNLINSFSPNPKGARKNS